MRKRQPEFVVHKATRPHNGNRWYIVGRPEGKRIRAWFETKEAAELEAGERNTKMRKPGVPAVTLDCLIAYNYLPAFCSKGPMEFFRN